MLDSILLARAAWSVGDAATLVLELNLQRHPVDAVDAISLSRWQLLLPLLKQYGGDAPALRVATRADARLAAMFEFAVTLPSWLYDDEHLPELISVFNSGSAAEWRPTTHGAELDVSLLDDGAQVRVLTFIVRLGFGLAEGRSVAALRLAQFLVRDIHLSRCATARLLASWNDSNLPQLRDHELKDILADACTPHSLIGVST
jgi:hypothetical protein